MNELIPNGSSIDGKNSQTFTSAHVLALLKGATISPKVIMGARRGVFDVSRHEVENFFHLIDQRVNDQQTCSLDKFEISIYFSDGTSIRLPSIKDFQDYVQTKNIGATVVSFHWTLLIQFPNNESPEKQEIDITLRSSEIPGEAVDMEMNENSFRLSGDRVQLRVGPGKGDLGAISYTINHTRVSWGLDIENVITSHLSKLVEKEGRWDRIIKKISGPLNLFTTLFVGLYLVNKIIDLLFFFLISSEVTRNQMSVTEIASTYLVNGHIAKYIVASLVVGVVTVVLFSAFLDVLFNSIKRPKPSFISLSDHDTKRKNKKLKEHEKRWSKLVSVFVMNIVVALIIAFSESRVSEILSGWKLF